MRRGLMLVVAAVLILGVAAWVIPRVGIPSRFWLAPLETVTVGERNLDVVRVSYAQGLREVESLGSLDAALFVLDQPAPPTAGMGMYDTRIPLDVVFFDPDGKFLGRHTMPVCPGEECPGYYPEGTWQFAIEAPAGSLSWIGNGAQLER